MVRKFVDTSLSRLKEPLPVPEYLTIIHMNDLTAKSKNDLEALQLQPASLANVLVPGPPKPPYHGIPLHIPFYRPFRIPEMLEINPKTKVANVLNRVHGWLKITGWQQKIAHEIRDRCIETRTFNKFKFRREFRFRVRAEKRKRLKEGGGRVSKEQLLERDENYRLYKECDNVDADYLSRLPQPEKDPKAEKKPKAKKVKKKKVVKKEAEDEENEVKVDSYT